VAEVTWQSRALEDLEEIRRSKARDTPAYAADFVFWLMLVVNRIEGRPRRGRVMPDFTPDDVREVFVRDHRIVYRIAGDEVEILAIRHGTRSLWDISDPSEGQPADASGRRHRDERASDSTPGLPDLMQGPVVTKEQMLHAIRSLPKDATARDAAYALETVEAINIAIAEADAGLTIPHEEIEQEVARWLAEDAARGSS
jgi:toxin ParE1/3/4